METNHLNDKHHVRLEWMIIILIMVEVNKSNLTVFVMALIYVSTRFFFLAGFPFYLFGIFQEPFMTVFFCFYFLPGL